ncbi:MAG: HD domain-containing phosphohydrolase [Solirubrobacteraceae bacterium]
MLAKRTSAMWNGWAGDCGVRVPGAGVFCGSELTPDRARNDAPAEGAVVTAHAPLVDFVRTLRGDLDNQRQGLSKSDLAGTGPAPRTHGQLLVVDDDIEVRRLLTAILSEAGHDVRDVASARQARHALEHETIALLISEVSLPGETGLDLMRFARCAQPDIAIVLISALDDPGIARVAIDHGAYGYLSKPLGASAVLIGVMNALRRRDLEAREHAAREDTALAVRLRERALSEALEPLERAAEHSQRLQAETLYRWARMAEHRDPGIGSHLKRMSRYCAVLGDRLGLHAESLQRASLLHDVGKIAIADGILLNPGPLTADERLAVESHAEFGYEMLRGSSSGLLDLAALIARHHHERFDGSGYPAGLSGADIPLVARIAAVADVFDALTCERVYRSAWSIKAAVAWMKRARGGHFDPCVVDALLSSLDEILAIRDSVARA